MRISTSLVASLVVPALVMVGLHFAGFWIWAGAHPFWSAKGVYLGVVIGLVLLGMSALIAKRRGTKPMVFAVIFGLAAIAIGAFALNGKEAFAVSYARDGLAGRYWYFGYIASMASIYAALVSFGLGLMQVGTNAKASTPR